MAHPEASLGMKIIELIKLININLNHFPKHEKYGLCQKIRNVMYEVYNYWKRKKNSNVWLF